jgi:hypothetical protein
MDREQSAGAPGGATSQAKDKAKRLASQAQAQVAQKLGASAASLKDPAASAINHYAEAVRQLGEQFRQQNRGLMGQYADRAAGQMEQLASYLERTDVDEVRREIESLARRRPGLFMGAAFTVGVGAARFIRSSRRQQQSQTAARDLGTAGSDSLRPSPQAFAGARDGATTAPASDDYLTL